MKLFDDPDVITAHVEAPDSKSAETLARSDAMDAMDDEELPRYPGHRVATTIRTRVRKESKRGLPELVSPTVRLDPCIRRVVVQYCHDAETSFSVLTSRMWLELLQSKGLVNEDVELPLHASFGRTQEMQECAYTRKIEKLTAQLEEEKNKH